MQYNMALISDVFIQNTSGIPYVARCFGGDYCKMHMDHALITGFFAALNSFKGEFGQEAMRMVDFDKVTLVMEQFGEFLVIIGTDEFDSHPKVREVAKDIMEEFRARFGEQLERQASKIPDFKEYVDWLEEKIGKAMGDLKPMLEKKNEGFVSKLKNIFSR